MKAVCKIILVIGISAVILSCTDQNYTLSESELFNDGQCNIVERYTAVKGAIKGDPTVHLILNCQGDSNRTSIQNFELLSTRYREFFNLSVKDSVDVEKKQTVVIQYCKYRSFESFEEVSHRIQELIKEHEATLSFNIIVQENDMPCKAQKFD